MEISTKDLLTRDGFDTDRNVERIAMAMCELLLHRTKHEAGDNKDAYKKGTDALRSKLIDSENTVHLLYWFDVRTGYWQTHKSSAESPDVIQGALDQLVKEALAVQVAALPWDKRHDAGQPKNVCAALTTMVEICGVI